MRSEEQQFEMKGDGAGAETLPCPTCGALMVRGMRFCRLCGYRLGEGVEEYAETRRFSGVTHASRPSATTAPPKEWGAVAATPTLETSALKQAGPSTFPLSKLLACKVRMPWIMWVILALVISSAAGGLFIGGSRGGRMRPGAGITAPRSYFGVNAFKDADGGALIDKVDPPGSPADRAGLIGGDIVTKFDGQVVKGRSDLNRMLGATPVGKTVEVAFTRDGETKTAMLTTVSKDEMERMKDAFGNRPEGRGFFGIDDDELERVLVPGSNIYGVRLDDVLRNRPAYIAGLRNGDILIEFGGIPVRTPEEFLARIKRAVPDSTVKVVIVRGTERLEIPVKMGGDD